MGMSRQMIGSSLLFADGFRISPDAMKTFQTQQIVTHSDCSVRYKMRIKYGFIYCNHSRNMV